ncbi:hypothetical protein DLAC_08016 [Tieghemostelium lacteum]|uniref:Nucleoside diphosphate kinase-like domain-containing protein n=1 Tax=Tieghemostelium lacteum TaxID=361077 RepID=A0A151ZAY5_TIELA|nr:hypothetical protein DLAC_08016 [Tieghemostelium lacteum]|eukprot:KYQ91110.1 hypothetical protein DLAC_08016 [Tieghemostelium lacteum]
MSFRFTLAIIKPDIFVKQPNNVKSIIEKIESRFIIHTSKQINLSIQDAEQFYHDHREKFFYERLISFMTRGPILPMVLEYKNNDQNNDTIKNWRDFIGPTHREKAKTMNCLRGEYGTSDTRNSFHGSGSEEEAKKEIVFFFPKFDFNNPKSN